MLNAEAEKGQVALLHSPCHSLLILHLSGHETVLLQLRTASEDMAR